jgi:2-keto-4-pentenoate hydratase/2-oxohepta-3-ene-1,7-dioic acid hydratase in catechol pathway
MKPPRVLRAGDTMTLGVDGLGQQTQHVVAWKAG